MSEKRVYTVGEIAQMLCIGRTKAYEMVRAREIPAIFLGKTIRIPVMLFERWLEKAGKINQDEENIERTFSCPGTEKRRKK